jgi:phospholipase C
MPWVTKFLIVFLIVLLAVLFGNCGTGPKAPVPASGSSTAPTVIFAASSASIASGEFVTLTWVVTNGTSVTISPNVNETDDGQLLPLSGSRTLVLQNTTNYVMTAIGPGGSTTSHVTVSVHAAVPSLTFEADPVTILPGAPSNLRWSTTAATSLTVDNGIGAQAPGVGSVQVSPATTTTYTAVASGTGGTITGSATVTVAADTELAISISADATTIKKGDSTNLQWSSQNATSVSIAPIVGSVNLSGGLAVSPVVTTTYTATAASASGAIKTASVIVNVVSSSAGLENIKHIVLFVQENRSFDNYFSKLGLYKAAKGLPNDIDAMDVTRKLQTYSGKSVTPFHQRTVETDVMTPSWNESHFYADRQADGTFKLDNWMMQQKCSIYVASDPECTRSLGYYDETDIPYYYEIAAEFGTSDSFFSSAMSGTIVNRSYLLSATSGGMNDPDDPFPVNAPTIFRRLSEAGISWLYIYQDDSVFLGYYVCGGACDWDKYKNNAVPISKYYEILSRPTADQDLPQVVFIEHAAKLRLDEHTGNNIQLGVADAKQIIDALLKSTAWPSSVFFLSHDEGGGMYDHVAPYVVSNPDDITPVFKDTDIGRWDDFTFSGYRVPLLVISPWVKPHFVSHKQREFTSFLRFIETRYSLAPLTKRDAEADDMLEFFDFSTPVWLTPPPLPDQPTNGVVDRSLQAYPF